MRLAPNPLSAPQICSVVGTPTHESWPEGMKLAAGIGFQWPSFAPTPLHKLIPHASPEAIELIGALCHWDPSRRPTAAQCLQMPFFQVGIQRSPRPSDGVQGGSGADPLLDSSIDLGESGLSPVPRAGGERGRGGGGAPGLLSRSSSDFGDVLAEELAQAQQLAQRGREREEEAARRQRDAAVDPLGLAEPQEGAGAAAGARAEPGQLSAHGSWGGFAPLAPQDSGGGAGAGGALPFGGAQGQSQGQEQGQGQGQAQGLGQGQGQKKAGLPPPPKLPAVPVLGGGAGAGAGAGGPLAGGSPMVPPSVGRRGRDPSAAGPPPDSLEEMLVRSARALQTPSPNSLRARLRAGRFPPSLHASAHIHAQRTASASNPFPS